MGAIGFRESVDRPLNEEVVRSHVFSVIRIGGERKKRSEPQAYLDLSE